jgi:hypothetical protein
MRLPDNFTQRDGCGSIAGTGPEKCSARRSQASAKDAQAQHEMPGLQRFPRIASLRKQFAQFDTGIHRRNQQQHQPVQRDG